MNWNLWLYWSIYGQCCALMSIFYWTVFFLLFNCFVLMIYSINRRFSSNFTSSLTIYWCWHLCHSAFTCCHWYYSCFQSNVFLAFPNRRHTAVPLYDMMLKFYQLMYVAAFPASEQTNKHWGWKYCCEKIWKEKPCFNF